VGTIAPSQVDNVPQCLFSTVSIHGLGTRCLAIAMAVTLSLAHDISGRVDSNEDDCDPSGGAADPSDDGSGSESDLALHRSRLLPLFRTAEASSYTGGRHTNIVNNDPIALYWKHHIKKAL
jgi:hypothetical protein